ncbi:MAG TPA: FKBP-type peptidyl-prolyl cis-trans isomerase, partial [Solirubrobacterales bacterium]|nr:FKBP-type peptidyl-prolyl cis-trans isomerase [Solirubrobacterales bacterium]
MHRILLIIVACLALAVAGCGSDSSTSTSDETSTTAEQPAETTESTEEKTKPEVTPPQGAPPKKLVVEDLEEGTGPAAKAGDEVTVQYVGIDYKTGKQFDASWDRGEPLSFPLGANEVIPGWEKGVEGMKVGGRR